MTSIRAPVSPGLLAAALIAALCLVIQPDIESASAITPVAQPQLARVISFEHEIDFGAQVEVRAEVEAAQSVEEVRAVYVAAGPRQVSSYDYPEFTQRGEAVTVELAIDTGISAYYPPGTEFEVYFDLMFADNQSIATERRSFLYLDPSKDWQAIYPENVPLDFHYYGFSDEVAQGLVDRAAASWRDIADALGIDPETVERRKAIVYPDIEAASDTFPPTSAAATDGRFFGGFALSQYNLFVIGGPWPDTVVHELTHLLIGQVVNSPLSPGVPSWLHEGLAQYFEAGSAEFYSRRLSSAAESGSLLTLHTRNRVPSTSDEIGVYYLQVGSFVGELIEREGAEKMAATLRQINQGATASEAMETVYGKPLWQLESEWRVGLGAQPLQAPDEEDLSSPEPQATATPEPTTVGDSGVELEPEEPPEDDGFDMTGPVIGAVVAAIVFAAWSFFVSRRRFRRYRR